MKYEIWQRGDVRMDNPAHNWKPVAIVPEAQLVMTVQNYGKGYILLGRKIGEEWFRFPGFERYENPPTHWHEVPYCPMDLS